MTEMKSAVELKFLRHHITDSGINIINKTTRQKEAEIKKVQNAGKCDDEKISTNVKCDANVNAESKESKTNVKSSQPKGKSKKKKKRRDF